MTIRDHLSSWALVGWCPGLLATIAARPRWVVPWIIGTIACVVQTTALTAPAFAWIDEPFPDVATYLHQAVRVLPLGILALIVFWACVFALTATAGESARHPRMAVFARLLCVSPLATILPGTAWSICAFMAELAANLNPGQGPAWLHSPFMLRLGSPRWMLLGLGLMLANVVAAYPAAMAKLRNQTFPSCPKCGYILTGNVSGICPECGVKVEQPEEANDSD